MALNGPCNVRAIQSSEWWLKGDWMAPFSFHRMVAFRLVLCANLDEIVPMILEKKPKIWKVYDDKKSNDENLQILIREAH